MHALHVTRRQCGRHAASCPSILQALTYHATSKSSCRYTACILGHDKGTIRCIVPYKPVSSIIFNFDDSLAIYSSAQPLESASATFGSSNAPSILNNTAVAVIPAAAGISVIVRTQTQHDVRLLSIHHHQQTTARYHNGLSTAATQIHAGATSTTRQRIWEVEAVGMAHCHHPSHRYALPPLFIEAPSDSLHRRRQHPNAFLVAITTIAGQPRSPAHRHPDRPRSHEPCPYSSQ